ncbi:MAG: sulfur carrier protein ThiS [Candidatus Omnitrophica bacterium]|nr:sulfur carrier protein ThiS [Candidatus Omnitrophota bacterium]
MRITLNGKVEDVDAQLNLSELVLAKGLRVENVVIEYNFRILPKGEWFDTLLGENDSIEIISFIGGG